jgi:hypothetical protein
MFPNFDEWCEHVLHPQDTHPWNFRTREFYDEYRLKYNIAKLVQPKSILEVGVRFGYAAHAFLCAAPKALYVGLDVDEPSWGPYKGIPREWAELQLRRRWPNNDICTWRTNTQTEPQKFFAEQFDMIHIDADHSFDGALHDMQTFWPFCGKAMVVDDVTEIESVANAVKEFVLRTPYAISFGTAVAKRGAALIVRDYGY